MFAERSSRVGLDNTISKDIPVESDRSIHISDTNYSTRHSSGKFALLDEDFLVLYNLKYVPI